jgi:hypothetical protein
MQGVAMGDGTARLDDQGASNHMRLSMTQAGDGVPVTAFATAVQRLGGSVDLLKLDCEGFEWDILSDAESMRRVKMLTMEYHCWANNSDHAYVRSVLAPLGFEILKQVPSSTFGQVLARRREMRA